MARELAESTIAKLTKSLEEERLRLVAVIDEIELEREQMRLSETSAEHSPDPDSAEGGSLAFEMEKELSVQQNARDLLAKVDHAKVAVENGTYGTCEMCKKPIPLARLEALPYAVTCVECASLR
ncbi:MAG: hypothetical protein HKN07_05390 [Acidimicrobiia bacterium]|nr:hypothetical protein [Acidimicrobiia bacterium]